jgi:SAM-dependent methyltransferase
MNCDPIARWYRFFEYLAFGRALERRRREYLEEVRSARNVLILGDGDGRFTAEFVRRNVAAQVESVDLSSKMVALAEQRIECSARERVRFRVGDALTIELSGTYDLIVTHFFLDCFTEVELEGLVERLVTLSGRNARWLMSEFRLPERGLRRLAAKALIRFMYFGFWLVTELEVTRLPEYVPALERHGFQLRKSKSAMGGLLVSEMWELRSYGS